MRESLVLLKNQNGLLPLSPKQRILVAGDGATMSASRPAAGPSRGCPAGRARIAGPAEEPERPPAAVAEAADPR
ncbi:hypothetical protein C7E12_21755, partial [Stenotrophomonas maltophilia]